MGSSILQAILGGVAGGASGIAEVREARRLEEERKAQQQELERQRKRQEMLDIAGLSREGWMAPEKRTEQLRAASPGLQSVLSSAASMMGGGAPKAINMPSLQQGAGMFGAPAGEIEVPGGRKLILAESEPARRARERAQTLAEQRDMTREEREYQRGVQREERTFEASERSKIAELATTARGKGRNSPEAMELLSRSPSVYREIFPVITGGGGEQAMRSMQGLAWLSTQRNNPAVAQALQAVYAANPAMASDRNKGLAAYAIMETMGGGEQQKAPDVQQLRTRAGMNEMLLADQSMRTFEEKFRTGQVRITVPQRILQKLATDFANESTPMAKIINSAAYSQLAQTNPELAEYMRNVDAFAEGETMISSRPSNFRTKMAQFLSGIAAGSPAPVVDRVQQRRRGILVPLVDAYSGGNWDQAMRAAAVESGTGGEGASGQPAPAALSRQAFGTQWMASNPRTANETDEQYAARMRQAWTTYSGGR